MTTRIILTLDLSPVNIPVVSQLFLKFLTHCICNPTTSMFVKVAFLGVHVSTSLHRIPMFYLAKNPKIVSRSYLQKCLQLENPSWKGCQLTLEIVSLPESTDQWLLITFTPATTNKQTKKQWHFLRQSTTPLHLLFLHYNPYLNHIHPFSYIQKAFFTSNIIQQ